MVNLFFLLISSRILKRFRLQSREILIIFIQLLWFQFVCVKRLFMRSNISSPCLNINFFWAHMKLYLAVDSLRMVFLGISYVRCVRGLRNLTTRHVFSGHIWVIWIHSFYIWNVSFDGWEVCIFKVSILFKERSLSDISKNELRNTFQWKIIFIWEAI